LSAPLFIPKGTVAASEIVINYYGSQSLEYQEGTEPRLTAMEMRMSVMRTRQRTTIENIIRTGILSDFNTVFEYLKSKRVFPASE